MFTMQSLITLIAAALAVAPAIAVPVDVAHHNVQGGVGLNVPHTMRDLNGRGLTDPISNVLPPPPPTGNLPPPPQIPSPPAPGLPSRRDVEDDC